MEEILDLAWLMDECESEMGIRSGHAALEAKLSGIWTTSHCTEMSDRAFKAAAKSRRVLNRLNQLSRVNRQILLAAYEPRPVERALVNKHGRRLATLLVSRLGPKGARREGWAVISLTRASLAYKRASLGRAPRGTMGDGGAHGS